MRSSAGRPTVLVKVNFHHKDDDKCLMTEAMRHANALKRRRRVPVSRNDNRCTNRVS